MLPAHVIAGMLRLLRVTFLPVLSNNLQALRCEHYGDESFLRAAPHIDCWTSGHKRMVGFAVASLIIFSCGVPLVCTFIVIYGRRNKLLSKARYAEPTCNTPVIWELGGHQAYFMHATARMGQQSKFPLVIVLYVHAKQ